MEYIDFDLGSNPDEKLEELKELFPCVDWQISSHEHDLGNYYGLSVPDSQYEDAQNIIDKYSSDEITCIEDYTKELSVFYRGDKNELIEKLRKLKPEIEWSLPILYLFSKLPESNLKKVEVPFMQFIEAEKFINEIEEKLETA